MKKVIIHIGYHKTGTTFLNRKFFPAHPDVHHLGKPYDENNPVREIIERIIGSREYDFERCKKLFYEYINPIRKNKIVSISDGRIVNRIVDNDIKKIPKRLLNLSKDIVVIIVIRKQYDYLKSLYVQKIGVDNEKKSFNEWFDVNWESGIELKDQINYFDKIQAYIDVFGYEKVKVFLYEDFRENGDKFTQSLCESVGLDYRDFDNKPANSKRMNQRMTTLHRFIARYSLLSHIAIFTKKIVPMKFKNIVKKMILSSFDSYDPELSENRLNLVHRHTKIVNKKLMMDLGLDLQKHDYNIQ